jgi:uncharacterized protein YjiS (DUF1127 family)
MRPHYFDFDRYRSRGPYRRQSECNPCRALVELLRGVARLARRWLRSTRERQELARLDHRMLRDIGVTPNEVARECHKPFWRA